MTTRIDVKVPGEVPSVANLREHWAVKADRTKAQRTKAMIRVPKWPGLPVLVVTLTRVAPRELDSDNLASALKGIRDGVATRLGIDDGSKLVGWRYAQRTCPKGDEHTRVEVDQVAGGDKWEV